MKFRVTKDDICNGKRCSIYKCPIALAIKRKLGIRQYKFSVCVTTDHIGINSRYYVTPKEVADFISKFDSVFDTRILALPPFEFELPYKLIKKTQ